MNRGDNAVQIKVRLLNGGQIVTPAGEARVYVKKTDGTLVYNDCEINGDYVVIQTTTQMTAAAGKNLIELEMTQGETVLSTPIFWLCVGDSIADDSAIESSDEFTALEQALQDVEELKENGLKGDAATIQVGTVTTGEPGTDASVENSGTEGDAVFDFKIPRGDTGNGINSATAAVEYQQSDSGTEIPTGTWSTIIPEVPAGNYLWTRITIPYTDGNSTVSYSVAKMGDTGPPGSTEVDMDMVVTYDTPDTYTPPASGNTLDTWLGRVTRGLSSLFSSVSSLTSGLAQKLNASQVLTEEEWNTGTVSQRGYLADAKDILDEFAQLNTDLNNIWSRIYPVGSIYISLSATNPASLFGGSWKQITGRFLLAAGGGYSAGGTGGAATVTLTTNQIPSHTHRINDSVWMNVSGSKNIWFAQDTQGFYMNDVANGGRSSTSWTTYATGGGAEHNNMPPYYAVYMWRRTA